MGTLSEINQNRMTNTTYTLTRYHLFEESIKLKLIKSESSMVGLRGQGHVTELCDHNPLF